MRNRAWNGHLPQEIYTRIISASPGELTLTDKALTEGMESWDGVPNLAHYAALEALILVRMTRGGHRFRPVQGSLL